MEVDEKVLFYAAVVFMVSEYLWRFYINLRQNNVYRKQTHIPTELIGILSQNTFNKARVYALDKSHFQIITETFSFVCNILFLNSNGLVVLWTAVSTAVKNLGYEGNEMLQNVILSVVLNYIKFVSNMPFSMYYTFVLEEKHGFNKKTMTFFLSDKMKRQVFQQVVSVILICGITYLKIGDYFFLYLWGFVMFMTLFLYTIYPEYIAPMFDKYTPLEEGHLHSEIEKLANRVGFPLYKIYVVHRSKRSAHSNAYFYGLLRSKRVVLFDTLLKDYMPEGTKEKSEKDKKGCDTMEVLAVVAHELGHWKLNHNVKHIAICQVNLLFVFSVFGMLFKYKPLYAAFGFHDSQPMVIGLIIVIVFICLPYFKMVNFCIAMMSRHFEFQADAFAKSLGRTHYLKMALIKLNSDNLGFPIYDPLYAKWHLLHPPLLERLQALDKTE